jgi:hypothetical protein
MATLKETLERLGNVELSPAGGAKATEEKRDAEKFKKEQLSLLERIAKSVSGGKPGTGKVAAGAAATGGGFGLSAAIPGLGKLIGPAALLAGAAMMIKDGIAGYFKSDEWGVSKLSGTIGGLFGGVDSGLKGALWGGMKWALIGATIGSVVPVIGTAIGGAIGALLGALLGWIGGEKIAKFIDDTGIWLSEKWDIIKEFPGKIWNAIVGTVKGWLGLGPKEEIPITVTVTDKPEEDWLTSLIKFIIPPWLIDFAKDALGTVLKWLNLTKEDNQGIVTTTAFGKLVFGTIGMLAGFAMQIINFFVPQFIKDFVKSPLTTVLSWLNLVTTDEEGEVTPTEMGKKVFGTITEIVDIFGSIITNIIGEDTVKAIKSFFTNPLDYILVDLLAWKSKEGTVTASGLEAVEQLEQKNVTGLLANIIKAIIGENIYKAITDFVKSPINYIMVHWLGWKTKTVGALGRAGAAGGTGGQLTATGLEAQEKLDEGAMVGFFGLVLDAILPKGLREFVKDPIDYIFVNWLKLGSKDDVHPISTAEKAKVIAGTAVGLWVDLLGAILPAGVVKFIESPINWVFGLFGWKTPAEALAEVKQAHGLTVGDEESRTGIFDKILKAVLPAGVLKFIENPFHWVLKTFLGEKAVAIIAGTPVSDAQAIIKESEEDPAGLFNKILESVIPKGVLDFIKSPWSWIKTKFGWSDTSTEKMEMIDPVTKKPIVVGETEGLFSKILKSMLPDGLVDFLQNPISWVLKTLGITKSTEAPKLGDIAGDEKSRIAHREKMINSILETWPGAEWSRPDWIIKKTAALILDAMGMAKGGPFQKGQPMLVGELGPELILPSTGGVVMNAQRTAQIQEAGLRRGAMGQGGGAPALFAPISNVNTNQTNMTQTSTSFSHPSPILATVNAAA